MRLHRLAGMPWEGPLGVGVESDRPHVQIVQQPGGGDRAGPVGAVQHRGQAGGADRVGIDQRHYAAQVRVGRAGGAMQSPHAPPVLRAELLPEVDALDLLLLVAGHLGAVGVDALDAVELGRVVRGGYHDPAGESVLLDVELHHRGGHHSYVYHLGAGGHEAAGHRALDHVR